MELKDEEYKNIDKCEVLRYLKKMKYGNSCGMDMITSGLVV